MNDQTEFKKNNQQEPLPPGIAGWSWGAFFLTWIWGLGNRTYRALWCFVPIVGICMRIALGIKGREWAWRHKKWESIEQFNKVQKRWSIVGLILVVCLGLCFALAFLVPYQYKI
ncbi:MAG: ribonuclease G [Gammaproteobacteria bacterium]|nr:ribonuclease G [Gammaproteobacteria bacterium]